MPADASIYSLIRPAQQGPGPMEQYGQAMQLRSLIDDQGLKQLQRQQLERGMADDSALREAEIESGGDPAKMREALSRRGLTKQRMATDSAALEAETKRADILKKQGETLAIGVKQLREFAQMARSDADMPVLREVANRLLPPQVAAKMNIPDQFSPEWQRVAMESADQMLGRIQQELSRGVTVRGQDLSSETTRRGQDLTDARTRAEGAANRGVTIRGQDLTDTRARETTGAGRIPPGYRMTTAGNLEAIPGGPADIKAGAEGAKAALRKETLATAAGNVLNTIREAQKLAGWSTSGVGGLASSVPMTDARKLAGHIETIKANIGFDRLQQMRDMSPTGGALGQVAVQELSALQATIAKLDQLQSPGDVKEALGKIEQHYSRWLSTLDGKTPSAGGSGEWSVVK